MQYKSRQPEQALFRLLQHYKPFELSSFKLSHLCPLSAHYALLRFHFFPSSDSNFFSSQTLPIHSN
jgi:hypothetical protein